jgi:hypothetical protein
VKWKLVSVRLEILLILTQGRCTVCAKCILGIELLGDVGEMKAQFGPFGDSVNLGA